MRRFEPSAHSPLALNIARRFALALFLSYAPLSTPVAVLHAAEPALSFDFGRTLECRDVTPPEYSEQYPDNRIVECTLRLSVYLASGNIDEVDAIRVEVSDSDRRLRVFDFSPSTRLESALADDITWTKTTESSHSIGASLGGELPACIGGVVAHVTPTINAGKGGKEVIKETQKRVAPRTAVIASGTIDHEHGVFFTLRPSPTSSLEGVHELSVQFVVPAAWRGDAIRVSCQATGQQKMLWLKQHKVWAEKSTAVALYQAGDAVARRAAERHVKQ
jgi:hypothetical protein